MYCIRKAVPADSEMISKIHAACFVNQFLTLLAPRALSKYYRFFIEHSLGICFVAEENGTMAGFIAGWQECASYQRPLLYENGLCFALAIAGSFFRQPRLVLSLLKPRIKILMPFLKDYLLFKVFGKSGADALSTDKDKSIPRRRPNASYLSIAVLEQHRGSGVARLLNEAFIEECRLRNVSEIILSVHKDNHRARAFYEKNGWRLWRSEEKMIHYIYTIGQRVNAPNERPFVSVIMPVRNEAQFIGRSLSSVLNQDYPLNNIEIIVVDGMSNDGTRAMINTIAYQRNNNGTVRSSNIVILDNPAGIRPAALNLGLKQARGNIIVRVDGHCEIASDYVRRCVEALEETKADCVGGLQRPQACGLRGGAIALAIASPFGAGNAYFRYREKSGWVDTVYLGAYRREVFEQIGLFDEEMVCNEDDELNFRLIQAGGKIWLEPSIFSVYFGRKDFRSLWQQYFTYGLYKVKVIQKRRAIPSLRNIIPLIFFLALLGSSLLTIVTANIFWFAMVILPYLSLNMIFSIWSARKKLSSFVCLPLSFFIIHISYGAGFLCGILLSRTHSKKSRIACHMRRAV